MARRSIPVPSLVQGVSQQPPEYRPPVYAEAQENGHSTQDGLGRRPGTRNVVQVSGGGPRPTFHLHGIERGDGQEQYALLLGNETVEVRDPVTGESFEVVDALGAPLTGANASYLNLRRTNPVTNPELFVTTWTHTLPFNPPGTSPNSTTGPLGIGDWIRITIAAGGLTGSYSQTVGTWNIGHQVLSCYFWLDPFITDADQTQFDVSLVLQDTTGTLVDYEAVFEWDESGQLGLKSVSGAAVSGGVEYLGDYLGGGVFRAYVAVDQGATAGTTVGDTRVVKVEATAHASKARFLHVWGAMLEAGLETPGDYIHDPHTALRALTIGDTTFVLNRQVATALGSSTAEALTDVVGGGFVDHALIYIRQVAANTAYSFEVVTGAGTATHTENSGATPSAETMAANIATALGGAGAWITASVGGFKNGGVVSIATTSEIQRVSATDDTGGGTFAVAAAREVGSLADLPPYAPVGSRFKIVGSPAPETATTVGHWVRFRAKGKDYASVALGTFAEGFWEESTDYGVTLDLDETTWPHTLVREQDTLAAPVTGEPGKLFFRWQPYAWVDRAVGDDDLNAPPSVISSGDGALDGIFFHRSRLGLYATDRVILSEVNRYSNLWLTTTQILADSDRIDGPINAVRAVRIDHVLSQATRLFLFAGQDQFLLHDGGSGVLSPRTITVDPVSAFKGDTGAAPPAAVGNEIVFTTPSSNGYLGVVALSPGQDVTQYEPRELTAAVPRYIPGPGGRDMAVSGDGRTLVVLPSEDLDSLYVLQRTVAGSGDRELQLAWSRWTFPGASVEGVVFIDERLYLVAVRGGPMFLEELDLDHLQAPAGAPFPLAIDRRTPDTGLSKSYNAGSGNTTIDLPWTITPGGSAFAVGQDGTEITVVSQDTVSAPNKVVVAGDYSATAVYVGESFETVYTFSRPTVRQPAGQGSYATAVPVVVLEGLLLQYAATSRFDFEVAVEGSATETLQEVAADPLSPAAGVLDALIGGEPRATTVRIRSSYAQPFFATLAEWLVETGQAATILRP